MIGEADSPYAVPSVYDIEIECSHCSQSVEITDEIADSLEGQYDPAYPEFCDPCNKQFEEEDETRS